MMMAGVTLGRRGAAAAIAAASRGCELCGPAGSKQAMRALSSGAGDIKRVGVVGLGLMGHGIAQTAAQSGFDVVAVDSSAEAVARGMGLIDGSLTNIYSKAAAKGKYDSKEAAAAAQTEVRARITSGSDLGLLADCDIVVEAIIEDVEIKKAFWADLGPRVQPDAIFASNTSSFCIEHMAEPSGRPDKMVGLHFFNPVQ